MTVPAAEIFLRLLMALRFKRVLAPFAVSMSVSHDAGLQYQKSPSRVVVGLLNLVKGSLLYKD